jgi:hypothetical protein
MKKIFYIILTVLWMLHPNANFATVRHYTPNVTKIVMAKSLKKSKKIEIGDLLSMVVSLFFIGVLIGSISFLVIGLISGNGLQIILGSIGVLLLLYVWYRAATRCG